MKTQAKWSNRLILDPKDSDQLDATAAEKEFKDRIPRSKAEEETHRDYQKTKHREAAAFHLQGVRAAHVNGQLDQAQKHGALYIKHMKALGHDPVAEPPAEIKKLAEAEDGHKVYKFKAHAADQFVLEPQPSEKKEDAPMSEPKEMTKAEKVDAMWADLRKKEQVRNRLGTIASALGHLRKDEPSTKEASKQLESTPGLTRTQLNKSEAELKADEFFATKYQRDVGFSYDERPVRKTEDTPTASPVVKAAETLRKSKEDAAAEAEKRQGLKKTEKQEKAEEIRKKADEFFKGYSNQSGFQYEE
jgi:hypothetical protein